MDSPYKAPAKSALERFGKSEGSATLDFQPTAQSYAVEIRYKTGRLPEFCAWAMLNDGGIVEEFTDRDGISQQRMVIIFAQMMIWIEGHFLEDIIRALKTERLIVLTELDAGEANKLEDRRRNDPSAAKEIIGVARKITVEPSLKERVKNFRNRLERENGDEDRPD